MSTEQSIQGTGDHGENRRRRGQELYERGVFERITRDVFVVQNPKTMGVYTVNLERVSCTCSDFEHHGHIPEFKCKHIYGVERYAAWVRKTARALAPFFGGEAA